MSARALAAVVLLLSACDDSEKAVDPVWGKQACGSCSMLVSEPSHAAELTTSDGIRVFFDDPGCMAAYLHEHHVQPAHMWVRGDTWVNARDARYARGARTPMAYGFALDDTGDATWADVEAAAVARQKKGSDSS